MEKTWKTIDGEAVPDLNGTLAGLLALPGEREVHVGSDSQQDRKSTEFVTVVVVLEKGKGGRGFYSREKVPRVRSLRERLLKEVWMSVNVGLEINGLIPRGMPLTVHVDANTDVRFRSSDYVKELTSMVVSQGFRTLLKPESWAATHIADHVVKRKVLGL